MQDYGAMRYGLNNYANLYGAVTRPYHYKGALHGIIHADVLYASEVPAGISGALDNWRGHRPYTVQRSDSKKGCWLLLSYAEAEIA